MKHLLILTSFFLSILATSNTLYTIQNGDTIYKIANEKNLNIKNIFEANKEIGLNPDFIRPGQIIYLPKSEIDIYKKYCSIYGHHDHSFISLEKVDHNKCMNFLERNIDTSIFQLNIRDTLFWDTFFSDLGYSYYLIYKFGDISKPFMTWEEAVANEEVLYYLNLIIEAAEKNSELALLFLAEEYFLPDSLRKKTSGLNILIDFWDIDNSEEFKNFCTINFDRLMNINLQNLKIAYLSECSYHFFHSGMTSELYKYDQALIEMFSKYESTYINDDLIGELANISYRLLNTNRNSEVLILVESFINKVCSECFKYQAEYTTSMPTSNFYNAWIDFNNEGNITTNYTWYALHMLSLNYSSAFYEIKSVSTEDLIKDRKHTIMLVQDDIETNKNTEWEEFFIDASIHINSDTGLKLLNRGECKLAKEYLDKVFDYYIEQSKGSFSDAADDIFSEPIFLMNCYANKGLYLDYEYYIDYLNKAYVKHDYKLQIYDLVNESIDLLIKYKKKSIKPSENDIISLINETKNYGTNSLNLLQLDLFTVLNVNLYKLASVLEKEYIYESLFEINNIKENLVALNKFNDSLDTNNLFKKSIYENEQKIKKLTSSDDFSKESYQEMLNLIRINKDLISKTISTDIKKDNYYSKKLSLIDLKEKLNSNQYIIQFLTDDYDGGIVNLISSEESKIFSIKNTFYTKKQIENLNLSMNSNEKFDFLTSNKIYDAVLKEALNEIPKESTIYILSGAFEDLAPYILVKNYDESRDMTDSEKIFQADWLINDYFFARLNYMNVQKSKSKFSEPFLGYGNSSTLNWVGLPNLNEVNNEIINAALASSASKENILINNLATKENFLKRIQSATKKIIISTHAVPKDWLGLTKEPSLVFNSYKGDIFLTPSEIIELDIYTEMLILSSCNANTKGFNEIPKAFLTAGAETIVYTNWNLESKFAGEFTKSFLSDLWYYEKPKHETLRETSLKFLYDYSNSVYSHPSFWGNFAMVYSDII